MQVIYKGERKKFFNYDYTNLIEEFHVQISLPGTYLCLLSILILYCIYCRRYPCHLLIASSYRITIIPIWLKNFMSKSLSQIYRKKPRELPLGTAQKCVVPNLAAAKSRMLRAFHRLLLPATGLSPHATENWTGWVFPMSGFAVRQRNARRSSMDENKDTANELQADWSYDWMTNPASAHRNNTVKGFEWSSLLYLELDLAIISAAMMAPATLESPENSWFWISHYHLGAQVYGLTHHSRGPDFGHGCHGFYHFPSPIVGPHFGISFFLG